MARLRVNTRKDRGSKMARTSVASAVITIRSRITKNSHPTTVHLKPLVEGVEVAGVTGWGEMVGRLLVLLLGFLSRLQAGSQSCLLHFLDLTRMTPWLR